MSKEKFEQMKEKESTETVQWDIHEKFDNTPLAFTDENKISTLDKEIEAKAFKGLISIEAERDLLIQSSINALKLEINSENMEVFENHSKLWLKNRTQGYDKWKKAEKDYSLKYNALIDSKYNKEMLINKDWEEKFSNAKNHFKILEAKKAKVLNDSRIEKIKLYVENAEQMDFKEFSEEDFDDFVFGKKVKHEQRIEEERLENEYIENERIAKEKEIEATRLENIELKRIADEKENALKLEREANEKKAQAEQKERERLANIENDKLAKTKAENEAKLKDANDARLKLEKELQDKKDDETKAENERKAKELADQKEAEKLAKAPIKDQLNVWVDSFEMALAPISNATSIEILEKFEAFKKWAKSEINKF